MPWLFLVRLARTSNLRFVFEAPPSTVSGEANGGSYSFGFDVLDMSNMAGTCPIAKAEETTHIEYTRAVSQVS